MGIFSGRRWFKVILKCTTPQGHHSECYAVSVDGGFDLEKKLLVEHDSELIDYLFVHNCKNCVITVEKIEKEDVKNAKRWYPIKKI